MTYANKAVDPTVTITRVVNLRPGETLTADQSLSRATGTMFGTVAGKPSVENSNTIVLAGATLTATPRSPLTGAARTMNITSTGEFTFSGVEAGEYDVVTTFGNYVTDTRIVTVPANRSEFVSVVLAAAARPVTILVSSSKVGVALPVTALEVYRPADQAGTLIARNTSGGSALFNLAPGTWVVRTTNAANPTDPHADEAGRTFVVGVGDADPNLRVSLNRYEELAFALSAKDNVDATATSLVDATVTASTGGGTPQTMIHQGLGVYKVRSPLTGTVTIRAERAGYVTASTTVAAVVDGEATAALTLAAAPRSVTINVRSTITGTPALSGVTITATGVGTTPVVASPTVAGETSISLVPGTWTLTTTNAAVAVVGTSTSPHEDEVFTDTLTFTVSTPTTVTKTLDLTPSTGSTGTVRSIWTTDVFRSSRWQPGRSIGSDTTSGEPPAATTETPITLSTPRWGSGG